MSKKVTIKEEDIEAPPEETLEEIVEQVKAPAPTPAPAEPQKADTRMRVRELYKCDLCGKYLTKKSLNYSHLKRVEEIQRTKQRHQRNHLRKKNRHRRMRNPSQHHHHRSKYRSMSNHKSPSMNKCEWSEGGRTWRGLTDYQCLSLDFFCS